MKCLAKSEVVTNDVSHAVEIKETLKLHHVDCINPSQVEFCYNSTYKNVSLMLRSGNYDDGESSSAEVEASSEEEMSACNRDSTSEVEEFHSSIGDTSFCLLEAQ